MIDFLKQLFCKHNYIQWDELRCKFKFDDDCTMSCPITLLQCKKCGKRIILKDKDYLYNKEVLNKVNLWKKGVYNFESVDWGKVGETNDKDN